MPPLTTAQASRREQRKRHEKTPLTLLTLREDHSFYGLRSARRSLHVVAQPLQPPAHLAAEDAHQHGVQQRLQPARPRLDGVAKDHAGAPVRLRQKTPRA